MKRILGVVAATLLAACSVESDLPEASGKANLRMINAVPTSGEIVFVIEERSLGTASYPGITTTSSFDDLTYNFNFDVIYAGEAGPRRVATQFLDVIVDRDYTFFVSGSLANPTITVWEDDIRSFDDGSTAFASKFVHASASTPGELDFYFADPAVAPAAGEHVARLSAGEVSTRSDFAPGDYVLTVTTSGDPGDVIYQSGAVSFVAGNEFFTTLFDGDANNNSPLIAYALAVNGSEAPLLDASIPATVEFVNVSPDLGASDIYDDEALTSLRIVDHDYLDVEAEIDVATGTNDFFYTPTGDTSAVTLEGTLTANSGLRYRLYAQGVSGAYVTSSVRPDYKSLETMAKLTLYHGANNFELLDMYVLEAGDTVDENLPIRAAIGQGTQTLNTPLATGSYDLYLTEFNDKTVLAGPYRLDLVLGDIVDMVAVDTVDPAVLDILFLQGAPTP